MDNSDGSEADDALVGRTIGNYLILSRIGRGGMGAVYLAHHTVLGRDAAIKVLLPQFSNNPDLVGRFFKEARATAQLRHRGFVEVFDSGKLPGGSAYLVMDYLRGANLAECIEYSVSLPTPETLVILREVAVSVGFAHKHGIVHRDLKPDNIFLAIHGDGPSGQDQVTVKVLDFGIAKLTAAAAPDGRLAARTNTGVLLGTPLFMSPEQCRGGREVDHRSDIYSLGCIAYSMLTGKPPFLYDGFGEIISAHINEAPQPLRRLGPGVPASVEALVLRLLAKDPAERPQTMQAVSAALDELTRTLPEPGELLSLVPPAARPPADRAPSFPPETWTEATPPPERAAPVPAPTRRSRGSTSETVALPGAAGRGPERGRGTVSTLSTAASAIEHGHSLRRRPGRGVLLALVGIAGIAGGAFLLVGRNGALSGSPPATTAAANDRSDPVAPGEASSSGAASLEPPTTTPPAPAEAAAAAATPRTVSVRITSTPAGATVFESRTGRAVGVTPFSATMPQTSAETRFVVRKAGYRPKDLRVKLEHDSSVYLTLDRRARTAQPAATDPDDDRRKL
jgi:serine/threonine-protein kinase